LSLRGAAGDVAISKNEGGTASLRHDTRVAELQVAAWGGLFHLCSRLKGDLSNLEREVAERIADASKRYSEDPPSYA